MLKGHPLISVTRQGCPFSTFLFIVEPEVLARIIREDKKNTRHPNQKRKIKIIFPDDIILYVENPKDTVKELLK